jgi:hypothetical protein
MLLGGAIALWMTDSAVNLMDVGASIKGEPN